LESPQASLAALADADDEIDGRGMLIQTSEAEKHALVPFG